MLPALGTLEQGLRFWISVGCSECGLVLRRLQACAACSQSRPGPEFGLGMGVRLGVGPGIEFRLELGLDMDEVAAARPGSGSPWCSRLVEEIRICQKPPIQCTLDVPC